MLITDDDRDFRETLGAVFAPRGFRTLLASDGDEAVTIVRREQIHVVLLDMHMPRMTGIQTVHLVKQYKSRLPCILMSAEMDDAIEAEAEEADVYSILRKPVSRIDLTDNVKQALYRTYGWG